MLAKAWKNLHLVNRMETQALHLEQMIQSDPVSELGFFVVTQVIICLSEVGIYVQFI